MNNTPCVYKHVNSITQEVFYVGYSKDTKSRPYQRSKTTRNSKWSKYVFDNLNDDNSLVNVDIIPCVDDGEALKLEWDLIQELRPVANSQYSPAGEAEDLVVIDIESGGFTIKATSLKEYVNLTSLFKSVNDYRASIQKKRLNYTNFMQSKDTLEFISELKENGYEEPVRHNGGNGKSSKTYCCVTFAIYLMQQASARFNRIMIEEFIQGRILENREAPCDLFKGLNIAIDVHLNGREGKDNKGLFIQCSKRIKEIVKPTDGNWNKASAEQLKRRVEIEERIITVLSTGLVSGKEGLYSVIDSVAKI